MRKKINLYMMVTNDEYELPICVAESMNQLRKMQHVSAKTIRKALRKEAREFSVEIVRIEEDVNAKHSRKNKHSDQRDT